MTALLLDTHILVWFSEGSSDLKPPIAGTIDEALAEDGVLVSVFSFWEVAMLISRGRLTLKQTIDAWAESVRIAPGMTITPLSPTIAIESSRLPGSFHRDPADQIIVATAREMGAILVTHDRDILRYAETGHVKVLAA